MAGWLSSLRALFGYDPARIAKLEVGAATEADVRRQFGEPFHVATAADGSRTLEYPRQPEGWTNYFITIAADGTMSALRQALTAQHFTRVAPGMDRSELQALLGRPARMQTYALKQQEVWDWRYKDGQGSRLFSVALDSAGKVVSAQSIDDPKETLGGP